MKITFLLVIEQLIQACYDEAKGGREYAVVKYGIETILSQYNQKEKTKLQKVAL